MSRWNHGGIYIVLFKIPKMLYILSLCKCVCVCGGGVTPHRSTHLGEARQPVGARMLTTHRLSQR